MDGWIDHLACHRGDCALVVRALDGTTLLHNPVVPMPAASAIKLVHLAALAEAVTTDRISLDRPVLVGEWERRYRPLDGGAHLLARKHLGIPDDTQPERMVTVGQLADVMIRFSDSAAPDVLRGVLGDDALQTVMDRYRIPGAPTSFYDFYSRVHASGDLTADLSDVPPYATAGALADLMEAIATDTAPGAAIARDFLEWQTPDATGGRLGFKGGSLPGVRVEVFGYRHPEHGVAVGTLMVRHLPVDMPTGWAHQALLFGALTDPTILRKLVDAGIGTRG